MKSMEVRGDVVGKVVAALRGSALFKSLNDTQLQEAVSQTTLLQLEAGEELVARGEVPGGFFLLLAGGLRVLAEATGQQVEVELARFEPGQMVGVAGLLLDEPSSARIAAVVRSTVVRFEPRFFKVMSERVPAFGLEVARVMARRLVRALEHIPLPEADPGLRPTPEVLDLVPLEFIERHRLLPLAAEGDVLTVGFVDDPTPDLVQRLRTFVPAMEVRAVRLDARVLTEVLSSHLGGAGLPDAKAPPDSAALDRVLRAMVTEGASDLHLAGGQRPRWRIDGELREIEDAPVLGPESVLELLGPLMPERNREEFTSTNDTDFAHSLPGLARFRVNMFRDTGGVGAVFRQIPVAILSLEQLGMPPAVARFCSMPKGLVLVTGPTGSGKSTTLAAMVDLINHTRREHIVTLEDPVEFVHASRMAMVNQREVGAHTTSFARALRAALREDPDIVLVGEMRDLETVSLALETANTGHLVLGTLHTATAISTVDRVVGLFPSEQQNRIRAVLADVLVGVISQNLLRRVGGGRVAALEILVVNAAVANLVREGKTHQIASSMQTGKAAGNQLLNDSLAGLVTSGKVEYEEALSKAVDKADLARRLGRPADV
jgi:twitching motility protein PilT